MAVRITGSYEWDAIRNHLTPREKQILTLICEEGCTNKEIARRLGITPGTSKVYTSRMKKVLKRTGGPRSTLRMVIDYWKTRLAEETGRVDVGTS